MSPKKNVHAVSGYSRTRRHSIGNIPWQGTRWGATSIVTTQALGPNKSAHADTKSSAPRHAARSVTEAGGLAFCWLILKKPWDSRNASRARPNVVAPHITLRGPRLSRADHVPLTRPLR